MKFVCFAPDGADTFRPGAVLEGSVVDLEALADSLGTGEGLAAILAAQVDDSIELSERVNDAFTDARTHQRKGVNLGPPVASDSRVISLGGAFSSHLRARGSSLSMVPSQWVNPPTAVIGPGEPIVLTDRVRDETLPAVELGLVIGKGGRNIDEASALDHVAGFTVVNDVTARTDWPGPMAYKLMDTFCPCGPHVVPADDVPDPHDLAMEIRQDGDRICAGRTAGLRFTLSFIVSYLSTIMELRPGDVISTGDPAGVEEALEHGSTVELTIEDVGTLENPVIAR